MRFRLGPRMGQGQIWNLRTQLPTLASCEPLRGLAIELGLDVEEWFVADADETPLEACQADWRPAVRGLAADPRRVPSVDESVASFNRHVRPMERAKGTRSKYCTHRLSVLTWAVWKGVLPHLLPMSDDLLRAFLWDALAFEATLPVLKHCINAILAWHSLLALQAPLAGRRDYKRLVHCLSRFQGKPRQLIFSIYAGAVKRLLAYRVPDHPACGGVEGLCAVCLAFLHGWRNCLAGATTTLICSRGAEAAALQIRKNDQFRQGHQPRLGVARNPDFDVIDQLLAFQREAGLSVHPECAKRRHPERRCPLCPPMFPRSAGTGFGFVTDRPPSSSDLSRMIVDGLRQVGFDTSLFSGISARRGGLSTAIEAGVPEHILWMQSGHAQDVAARRYVQLGSPALLYETWAAFDL